MGIWRFFVISALGLVLVTGPQAQPRRETLADIRQEMSFIYVEIQRLKQELSTTGNTQSGTGSQGSQLKRLDSLEGEFRRITGKIEELEFRIQKIVKDGTNRIGDLEFRLVELEGGDVSSLGETSTLGGEDPNNRPIVVVPTTDGSAELAASEQVDYDAAKSAFDAGDYAQSADLFEVFARIYPGGPMTGEAHFWRGEALANLGQWSNSARAYLQSFSSAPDSAIAPRALLRLGTSLDRIGQREEACLTLNEVSLRYPDSQSSLDAQAEMRAMACNT